MPLTFQDDVFLSKEEIAHEVKEELTKSMCELCNLAQTGWEEGLRSSMRVGG